MEAKKYCQTVILLDKKTLKHTKNKNLFSKIKNI